MFFRPVGDRFMFQGKKYEVVEDEKEVCGSSCNEYGKRCAFFGELCNSASSIRGRCAKDNRTDGVGVKFVEVEEEQVKEQVEEKRYYTIVGRIMGKDDFNGFFDYRKCIHFWSGKHPLCRADVETAFKVKATEELQNRNANLLNLRLVEIQSMFTMTEDEYIAFFGSADFEEG